MNFWEKLPRPFFCLAPMEDVTDVVFRHVVALAGRPDVFFTEFTNTDSFCSEEGEHSTRDRLTFTEDENPIVAQIWGNKPENFATTARTLAERGFAGVDINMGCPDKKVVRVGGGSALIAGPGLAKEIIAAAREGWCSAGRGMFSAEDFLPSESETSIPDVPDRFVRKDGSAGAPVYDVSETDGSEEESIPLPAISVKTRLGYSKIDEWRPWLTTLLEQDLANLTVHLRTKKEMSKVPAHHELIPEIVALRDQIAPATKLTINGDIANLLQGLTLQEKYPGVDGFMIGRGVFDNPFCFTDIISPTREQLLDLFNYHLDQFDKFHELDSEIISSAHSNELVRSERSARKFGEIAVENNFILYKFEPLKRFFKIYVKDFPGAAELRVKLFECKNTSEVRDILLRAK